MNPESLLREGKLGEALSAVGAHLRDAPEDHRARTFLFELLCFTGELDRAEKQLDLLATLSPEAEVGVRAFRGVLEAERHRAGLFGDAPAPHTVADPPPWMQLHLQALAKIREEDYAGARELLDRSEKAQPRLQFTLDGEHGAELRDGDDLLAPIVEAIFQQRYIWIPLEQVKRIETQAPKRLRETYWLPGSVTLTDRHLGEVFLPVLYPGTFQHVDESVRLGRATDWIEHEGIVLGAGQHTWFLDGRDVGILEVREIEVER